MLCTASIEGTGFSILSKQLYLRLGDYDVYGRKKRRSVKNQPRYIGNLVSFLSRPALCTRAQNALERTLVTPFVEAVVIKLL